jgi:hypothetical protein
MKCQIRRCGGLGHREVKRPWNARVRISIAADPQQRGFKVRDYLVCEHCANLLVNDAREHGLTYERRVLAKCKGKGKPVSLYPGVYIEEMSKSPKERQKKRKRLSGHEKAQRALAKKAKEIDRRYRRKRD